MRLSGFIITLMLCLGSTGCRTQLLWSPFGVALPDFGIISHTNGAYVSTMATINIRCYADGGSVTLSGDILSSPFTLACASSGDITQLVTFVAGEGAKALTLTQNDALGTGHSETISVTLDSVAPAFTLAGPTSGSHFRTSVIVTGTCESALPITAEASGFTVSPASFACTGSGVFSQTLSISGGEGAVPLILQQKDLASNSQARPVSLTKDTSPPTIGFTNPADGSSIGASGDNFISACENGTNYTLSGSGIIGGGSFTCSGGSFDHVLTFSGGDGARTVTVVATDLAGNTSSDSVTITYDTNAPALTVTTPANGDHVKGTYTITGSCEAGLPVSLGGTITPSVSSFTCPVGGNFSRVVTFGALDGARTLSFEQVDAAGNTTTEVRNLTLDTVIPSVSFSTPANNSNQLGTLSISGACEEGLNVVLSGSGLSGGALSYTCSSNSFFFSGVTLAGVTGASGDGSKLLTITQTDLAGNSGTMNRTVIRDTVGPTINPAGFLGYYFGSAVSVERPTLSATTTDPAGVTSILLEYSNTGGSSYTLLTSGTSNFTFDWTTPAENVSNGRLRITAFDSLGNQTTFTQPIQIMTVVPAQAAAPNWNDYYLQSNNTACTSSTAVSSDPCIHGGEQRIVLAAGFSSCTDLTATDGLGAFTWTCAENGGNAWFYGQLKNDKGLRDLVNAASWRPNFVQIKQSNTTVRQTLNKPWWSNPVTALANNNSIVTQLNSPSQIYTLTGAITGIGLNLNADKIALVSLAGGSYNGFATTIPVNTNTGSGETGTGLSSLLAAGSNHFLWVEVEAFTQDISTNLNYGLFLVGSKYSRIHRSTFGRFGYVAITIKNGGGHRITQTRLGDIYQGLNLLNTNQNRISDLFVNNAWNFGVSITGSSKNVLNGLLISNLGRTSPAFEGLGIIFSSSAMSDNIITRFTITNSKDSGLVMQSGSTGVIHNGLLVNNARTSSLSALTLNDDTTVDAQNTFSQLAISESTIGIDAASVGANNKFTGNLIVSGTSKNCKGNGPTFGIYANGVDDCVNGSAGTLSNADFNSFPSLSASFFGKLSAASGGDSVNPSDNATGAALYNAATLNLFNFENPLRMWGIDAIFPGIAAANTCGTSQTCRIYDWRLLASTSEVVNNTDNVLTQNEAFVGGSNCPSAVHGSNVLTSALGTTYLKNAVELPNDYAGNDNGLCESNEACLYTPNFGYYQGEGLTNQCNFQNGAITGVKMFGFQAYGSPNP